VKDNPNGVVRTQVSEFSFNPSTMTGFLIMACDIWKERADADAGKVPDGTGYASMPIPGPTSFTKNSEAENAETSALGRALAMIGYHAKDTMASDDEIAMKSESSSTRTKTELPPTDGKADLSTRMKVRNFARTVLDTDTDGVKVWLKDQYGLESKDMTVEQAKDIMSTLAIMKAAGSKETKMAGVVVDE
jgi:hypothetical protein